MVNVAIAEALPIARTDKSNQFVGPQTILGDIIITGKFLDLHRPDAQSYSGIRFFRDDDPVPGRSELKHYFELGMDMAVGGYYFAMYDNAIDEDILKVGVDGPKAGRFNIGRDDIVSTEQVNIHDLDEGIQWSLATWSSHNGIRVNSKAKYADCYTLQRDNTDLRRWVHWHQGSGIYDWRLGMGLNTYDFELCCGSGQATSPEQPGKCWVAWRHNPERIEVNVPLICQELVELQQEVALLKAQLHGLEQRFNKAGVS